MNRFALVHGAWRLAARANDRRFVRALHHPEPTQLRVLRDLIAANRTSAFGRRQRFERIDSLADWRSRVPLSTGDQLADMTPKLLSGSAGLTTEPIRRLVPTSGSAGAVKLVPWTMSLARAFSAAIDPWMADLMRRHPEVTRGPSYWSVSPAVLPTLPEASVSVGFDDDTAYLGRWLEPLVGRVLLAPNALRHAEDADAFRYATLLLLLAARELRLISVWHPSFFSLLWQARGAWWDDLLQDLERGTLRVADALGPVAGTAVRQRLRANPQRARELAALGPKAGTRQIWPRLAVVSAWADGPASAPAAALAELIAPAVLERKGLLATEAMVTVPYAGRSPVAVCSHHFEFRDETGTLFAAHELRVGAHYEVIVSTQGGLYRYQLGDVVKVEGFLHGTPSLRFVGRNDRRVDQVGEKLSDAFVRAALEAAGAGRRGFIRLVPTPPRQNQPPSYTLLIDSTVRDPFELRDRMLAELRRNPYFAQGLDLGQLGPLGLFRVCGDADAQWLDLESAQRSLGSIKPTSLGTSASWETVLDGEPLFPTRGEP